jgi:hypothetical protein
MSSKKQHTRFQKLLHNKKTIAVGVLVSPLVVAALPVLLFAVPGKLLHDRQRAINRQSRNTREMARARERARREIAARSRPDPATCSHYYTSNSRCIFCTTKRPLDDSSRQPALGSDPVQHEMTLELPIGSAAMDADALFTFQDLEDSLSSAEKSRFSIREKVALAAEKRRFSAREMVAERDPANEGMRLIC